MNDSLQTNVFVRYPPESIACACIHLSSRILRVSKILHLFFENFLKKSFFAFRFHYQVNHYGMKCLMLILKVLKIFVNQF